MPFKQMELAVLATLIANIRKAGDELVVLIQQVATQAVYYSIADGNVQPMQQLYDALNSGARKDSLLAHFEIYGNAAWSKVEKKIVHFNRAKLTSQPALVWDDAYSEKVNKADWSKAKPAPTPKSVYDCEDEVRKFIKTMEKNVEKGIATKTHFYDVVATAYMSEQLNLRDAQFVGLAAREVNGTNGDDVVKSLTKQGCDKQRAIEIVEELGTEYVEAQVEDKVK